MTRRPDPAPLRRPALFWTVVAFTAGLVGVTVVRLTLG